MSTRLPCVTSKGSQAAIDSRWRMRVPATADTMLRTPQQDRCRRQPSVRVHHEAPARPVDQVEEAQRGLAAGLHGPAQRGHDRDEALPAPEHQDRRDEEDPGEDRRFVALNVREEKLHRVAERIAGEPDRQSPHDGARGVEDRERQRRTARGAVGDRNRHPESVEKPGRRDEHGAPALEPAVDPPVTRVVLEFPLEELLAPAAREPEPPLVRQAGCQDRQSDDQPDVEVAAVRQEGACDQERVRLNGDAEEEEQIPVVHQPGMNHSRPRPTSASFLL